MSPWSNAQDEHPDALLSALVDGELKDDERALVQAHLAICLSCEAELDEIRVTRRAMRMLGAVSPPNGFESIMREAITSGSVNSGSINSRQERKIRPLVTVGAAAASLALFAVYASNSSSSSKVLTQVPVASQQHASAVASLVGSGSLRQDVAPFVMPESLVIPESSSIDSTTSSTVARVNGDLPAPYQAPPFLDGGYELVEAFDLPNGIQLVYRRGNYGLSIFEEVGQIDRSTLPEGVSEVALNGDPGWVWNDPVIDGRIVVTEHNGLVITAVGDEPGDTVLEVVRALPGPRSLSISQRLGRLFDETFDRLNPLD